MLDGREGARRRAISQQDFRRAGPRRRGASSGGRIAVVLRQPRRSGAHRRLRTGPGGGGGGSRLRAVRRAGRGEPAPVGHRLATSRSLGRRARDGAAHSVPAARIRRRRLAPRRSRGLRNRQRPSGPRAGDARARGAGAAGLTGRHRHRRSVCGARRIDAPSHRAAPRRRPNPGGGAFPRPARPPDAADFTGRHLRVRRHARRQGARPAVSRRAVGGRARAPRRRARGPRDRPR